MKIHGDKSHITLSDGTKIPIIGFVTTPQKALSVSIRMMHPDDIDAIIGVDRSVFHSSWNKRDFRCALQDHTASCRIAEETGKRGAGIVGYAISGIVSNTLYVVRLAVFPEYRRFGIGTKLLRDITRRLSERRSMALAWIDERNLDAQLWLRANGWIAANQEREGIVFMMRWEWANR